MAGVVYAEHDVSDLVGADFDGVARVRRERPGVPRRSAPREGRRSQRQVHDEVKVEPPAEQQRSVQQQDRAGLGLGVGLPGGTVEVRVPQRREVAPGAAGAPRVDHLARERTGVHLVVVLVGVLPPELQAHRRRAQEVCRVHAGHRAAEGPQRRNQRVGQVFGVRGRMPVERHAQPVLGARAHRVDEVVHDAVLSQRADLHAHPPLRDGVEVEPLRTLTDEPADLMLRPGATGRPVERTELHGALGVADPAADGRQDVEPVPPHADLEREVTRTRRGVPGPPHVVDVAKRVGAESGPHKGLGRRCALLFAMQPTAALVVGLPAQARAPGGRHSTSIGVRR